MKKKVFYGWWIVLATNITCMLGYGTWLYSFGVFFKPMIAEFGWTRAMTAAAYSLRSVEGGLAAPVVGWAVDKYRSRAVIQFGAVISGLGFVMMYFVESLIGFYFVYAIWLSIGMSAMLYIPANAVIARWFRRRLTLALAVLAVGAGLGGLVCAPASNLLISMMGWRHAFMTVGVVLLVVVLPLTLLIKNDPSDKGLKPDGGRLQDDGNEAKAKEPDAEKPDAAKPDRAKPDTARPEDEAGPPRPATEYTLTQALKSLVFWILALAFGLALMGHAVVTVHTVPALTDAGIGSDQAAWAFGFVIFVSIVGRLSFGYLGDILDKHVLFAVAYVMQAAGIVVLAHARDLPMVYLFVVLFGVGFGATVPLMPAIRRDYFGLTAFAKIQGFMAPVTMVFSASGPIVAGFVFDVSGTYRWVFYTMAATLFLSALLLLLLRSARSIAERSARSIADGAPPAGPGTPLGTSV